MAYQKSMTNFKSANDGNHPQYAAKPAWKTRQVAVTDDSQYKNFADYKKIYGDVLRHPPEC